jgi:hypothetical protein
VTSSRESCGGMMEFSCDTQVAHVIFLCQAGLRCSSLRDPCAKGFTSPRCVERTHALLASNSDTGSRFPAGQGGVWVCDQLKWCGRYDCVRTCTHIGVAGAGR